jgi:hypothetical protein
MDVLTLKPLLSNDNISVEVLVNGEKIKVKDNVPDILAIKDSLVYLGNYSFPIFNCICGEPECGGIETKITTSEDTIIWRMLRPVKFSYIFDYEQYAQEFEKFQKEVKKFVEGKKKFKKNTFIKKFLDPL